MPAAGRDGSIVQPASVNGCAIDMPQSGRSITRRGPPAGVGCRSITVDAGEFVAPVVVTVTVPLSEPLAGNTPPVLLIDTMIVSGPEPSRGLTVIHG